jgi:RNA polymerase sigma-70 factor (ECF subfamily)
MAALAGDAKGENFLEGASNKRFGPVVISIKPREWPPGGGSEQLKSADEAKIDPAIVAALYVKHAEELRCFILGVLRSADLTTEVLQNTFAKAVEVGHTAREETLKGWLFRVAFNEAMALRRRQAVRDRAARKLADAAPAVVESPVDQACRWETVTRVRAALAQLPPQQRQVVQMRMYEQKKFITIAEELELPLGTVLTRMQAGLKKLRGKLGKE